MRVSFGSRERQARESESGKNIHSLLFLPEERLFFSSFSSRPASLLFLLFSERRRRRKLPCRGTSGCWIGCEGKKRERGREKVRTPYALSIRGIVVVRFKCSSVFLSLSVSLYFLNNKTHPASSSTRRWSSRSSASRTQARRRSWACSRPGRSRRCDCFLSPFLESIFSGGQTGKKKKHLSKPRPLSLSLKTHTRTHTHTLGHDPHRRLQHAQGHPRRRHHQALGPRGPAPVPLHVGALLPRRRRRRHGPRAWRRRRWRPCTRLLLLMRRHRRRHCCHRG